MEVFDDTNITDKEFHNKCVSLSNDIRDGKCTLLQVVENLQELLIHEDVGQREKGILVITTLLKALNKDDITSNEIDVICKFLLQRLKDHHSVLPVVIEAIKAIVDRHTIPDKLEITILSSIFENVPCQQQQQPDRYKIYSIFKRLLEVKEDELKSVGLDLVYGIISAIDSERDPKNLLFLFEWLPTFIQKIELGHLTEEMFEVLSCYFPVDFRPVSNESITREALAKSLSKCLCATPAFAENTIPMALEKLDSELMTAKLDSLDLLIDGSLVFSSEYYIKHSTDIWSLIQKNILTLKDDELVAKALTALTAFVKKITDSEANQYKPILSNIIDNLKGNLIPSATLFGISCRIILNFSSASKISSEYIFESVIPLLINLINITSNAKERNAVLAILCDLTYTCSKNFDIPNETMQQIGDTCLKTIAEHDTESKVAGFQNLSKIARLTTKETRNLFYESLKIILLSLDIPETLHKSVMDCLAIFAKIYPKEMEELIGNMGENINSNTLGAYLSMIDCVITTKELWNVGFKQLVHYAVQGKDNYSASLKILRDILEKNTDDELVRYLIEKENVIDNLIDSFLSKIHLYNIDSDENILDNTITILYRIIAKLSNEEQIKTLKSNIIKIQSRTVEEVIFIWCGLLFGLRDAYNNTNFVNDLMKTAFNVNNHYISTIASQLLANIINKSGNITDILSQIMERCVENLNENINIQNTMVVLTFVTKALVLRGHESSIIYTTKLLELSYKYDVARSAEIILSEKYPTLSAFCHCKERILHKQKFFSTVLNFIEEKSKPDDKNFLMIVAYLAHAIPKQILYMNFSKLVKWLILCINSCTDIEVLTNVITTINDVIENKQGHVDNCIGEILNCYINVALKNKFMKIRMLTLKGIYLLASYPMHKIVPMKEEVIQSLTASLDDPKRLVRKEAVETRLKWYFVDAPL